MRVGGVTLAWLAAWAVLFVDPVQRHFAAFDDSAPLFGSLIRIVAPALVGASLLYAWARPRWLRRIEPAALAALAAAPVLVWKPLAALTVLVLAAAAFALGHLVLRRLGFLEDDPLEALVLAAGCGFALISFALFLVGLLGGLSPGPVGLLTLAALLAGRRDLPACIPLLRRSVAAWAASGAATSFPAGVSSFFAAVFIVPAAMVALAPALAHDALAMHLPAARFYVERHALQPLPFLDYSYYPQSFELLMAAQWPFGGQAGAQLLSPLLFALTLAALALVGKTLGLSPAARWVGVASVFALPFVHWTGSVVKNDLALALFAALALYCRLRSADDSRWLRLSVFFLASGMAVKYTATFVVAPMGALYLWRLPRLRRPVREALLWVGLFSVFALGWPLRAYLLTGNPVHPSQMSWAVESLRPNEMRPVETRSIPYWKIPWTIHFDGPNAFESPSANPMGFFLLLFVPGWLFRRAATGRAARLATLVFTALFFLYWGSVWPIIRYAIVPLSALVLMTAGGLAAWREAVGPRVRLALDVALAANFAFCLMPALISSVNGPQLELFAGRISEREYLRRTLITYPALEYLSSAAKPRDWILSIGANSGAYAPDPGRIRYENLTDPDYGLLVLPDYLRIARYDWLIVPADRAEQALERLPDGWSCEERFRDDALSVCRLSGPPGLPEPAQLTAVSPGGYDQNCGQVAQLVERSPEKAGVGGSNPSLATISPLPFDSF